MKIWRTTLEYGRKLFRRSSHVTNPNQVSRVVTDTVKTVGDEAILGGKLVSQNSSIPKIEFIRQDILQFFSKSEEFSSIERKLTPEVLEAIEDRAYILSGISSANKFPFLRKDMHESIVKEINEIYESLSIANKTSILHGLPTKTKLELMDVGNCETIIPFANGNKPAATIYVKSSQLCGYSHPKIDIISEADCTTLLNRAQVKEIIEKNRAIFCNRMNCNPESSVDEIYAKLITAIESCHEPGAIDDIYGLTLGYPRKNTLIHHLTRFANEKNGTDYCWGELKDAAPEVIETYKQALRNALKEKDSPYANASPGLVKEVEEAINKISKITSSEEVLIGQERFQPTFIMYTPEPDEINRINSGLAELEKTISSGKMLRF